MHQPVLPWHISHRSYADALAGALQVAEADCTELTSVKAAYAHYGSEWFDSVAINMDGGEGYAQLRLLFR